MIHQFLHIIRWPNLLIVAAVQLLIYLTLIDSPQSTLRTVEMSLLMLITMLIAGSGYMINDYYDYEMDAINRPGRRVAGNKWSLSQVWRYYWYVVSVGAVLSVILAAIMGLLPFIFLYPIAVVALWAYSRFLKCMPMVGNVWVALFCAGVVLIIPLPDWLLGKTNAISFDILYYAAFAFLATWYREVIKDIEDKEGDAALGCRTMVVRYGVFFGKILALLLVVLLMLTVFQWTGIQAENSVVVALNILQGFIITSMALVWWAKDKTYFRMASLLIKIIMVLGTIVLLLL